jgi:hypothetical protein
VDSYWTNFCLPEYQNGVLKGFHMQKDPTDTTLGGKNAKCYQFRYGIGEQTYDCMQIIAVHGGIAYTLTYTAKMSDYGTHLETVEQIRNAVVLK